MARSITLSLPQVDILADQLDLNVRQYPFDIPRFNGPPQQHAQIADEVFSELETRGLARAGRPEPEVEDALYLLASSELSIAAAGLLDIRGGHRLAARVVATGEVGLTARTDGRTMRLDLMAPETVPTACVDLLPDAPLGSGQPMHVTARSEASHAEAPDADVRAAEAVLARPKFRIGHFVVSGTHRRGQRGRLPGVTWFDNDQGRYTLVARPSPAGQQSVTCAPADKSTIAGLLENLAGQAQANQM